MFKFDKLNFMGNSLKKPDILAPSGAVARSIFDFSVQSIDGSTVALETYRGKSAYIVVNVASQ